MGHFPVLVDDSSATGNIAPLGASFMGRRPAATLRRMAARGREVGLARRLSWGPKAPGRRETVRGVTIAAQVNGSAQDRLTLSHADVPTSQENQPTTTARTSAPAMVASRRRSSKRVATVAPVAKINTAAT